MEIVSIAGGTRSGKLYLLDQLVLDYLDRERERGNMEEIKILLLETKPRNRPRPNHRTSPSGTVSCRTSPSSGFAEDMLAGRSLESSEKKSSTQPS